VRQPRSSKYGETFGERVTEQRIGPCGFGCPMQRRPPGGIGNVGDEVRGV
jgi:hypothetical protein